VLTAPGAPSLTVTRTAIDGVLLLQPQVLRDERGFLMESYNQAGFDTAIGQTVRFVQDNHSRSSRGVLRVVGDLRRRSPSFGRWIGAELSDRNGRQLWLPAGMAHGFMVTSRIADCLYKTTAFYAPQCERRLRWNDPTLAIDWPKLDDPPLLSTKDAQAPWFDAMREFF
jgi:dTDP-4-dehydrorhamnose 3,5-epimerase